MPRDNAHVLKGGSVQKKVVNSVQIERLFDFCVGSEEDVKPCEEEEEHDVSVVKSTRDVTDTRHPFKLS